MHNRTNYRHPFIFFIFALCFIFSPTLEANAVSNTDINKSLIAQTGAQYEMYDPASTSTATLPAEYKFHPIASEETTYSSTVTNGVSSVVDNYTMWGRTGTFLKFEKNSADPMSVTINFSNVGIYNGSTIDMQVTITSDSTFMFGVDPETFLSEGNITTQYSKKGSIHFSYNFYYAGTTTNAPVNMYWNFSGLTVLETGKFISLDATPEKIIYPNNSIVKTDGNNSFGGDSHASQSLDINQITVLLKDVSTFNFTFYCDTSNGIDYLSSNNYLTSVPSYSATGIDISSTETFNSNSIYPENAAPFYSGILDMPDKLVSTVETYDIVVDNLDNDLIIDVDNDIKITNLNGVDKSSLFKKTLTESTDYPNKYKLTLNILTADLSETEIKTILNNIYYIKINAKVDLSKSIEQFDDTTGTKKYNYSSYAQTNGTKDVGNDTVSSTVSLPSVDLTVHSIESLTKKPIADSYTLTKFLDKPYEIVPKEISGFSYVTSDTPLTGNSSNLTANLSYKDIEAPTGSGKLTTVELNDSAKILNAEDYSVFLTDWSDNFTPKDQINITLTPNQNIEEIVSNPGEASFNVTLEDEAGNTSIVSVPIIVVAPTAGNLTVHYKDTENNPIAPDATFSGKVGDAYSTEQLSIEGYTFKEVQGNAVGTLTTDPQTVTYVYTKIPVTGATVTIQYHDTDGNTIAPNHLKTGSIGETYTSDQLTIDGYTFNKIEGDPTGTFTADPQTVTYIYTKNIVAGGNITIQYQDSKGIPLAPSVIKSGNIGETYTSEQLTIAGYTFNNVQGEPTGTFTVAPQIITYIYTKNIVAGAAITIVYQDTIGNTLAPTVTKSGNIGEGYTSEQLTIDGYTFSNVQGNPTGTFTTDPQIVKYIYTKNLIVGGNITIQYQDIEGNSLAPDVVKSGNMGDSYTSDQLSIDGYTFKETIGAPAGTFTTDPQTIRYIYTKNTPIDDPVNQTGTLTDKTTASATASEGKALPNTGERSATMLSVLGTCLLVSLGAYCMGKKTGKNS